MPVAKFWNMNLKSVKKKTFSWKMKLPFWIKESILFHWKEKKIWSSKTEKKKIKN